MIFNWIVVRKLTDWLANAECDCTERLSKKTSTWEASFNTWQRIMSTNSDPLPLRRPHLHPPTTPSTQVRMIFLKRSINRWKSPKKGHFWWISDTLKINVDHSLILDLDCNAGYHHHNHHQNGHSPMSLQIQIGGHIRTPPPLRTSIGSTGSNSSGHSSISHFSISPQEYLANPMFDSLNDHNRRKSGFNRYWLHNINHSSDNKTISLKPLVVKRTRSLQRKLPPIKNGCRVI